MQEQQEKNERRKIDDNVIYVGNKPFSNYVWAVLTQISSGKFDEVCVIARGKFISRAVDVVELTKHKFSSMGSEIKVKSIEIGSEKFDRKEENGGQGRKINVSMIKITLEKNKK